MIEFYEGSKSGLTLLSVKRWDSWKKNRVGEHKRVSQGKTYTNPRIILPTKLDLNDFIGRYFHTYRGKALLDTYEGGETVQKKGECIILFFPE